MRACGFKGVRRGKGGYIAVISINGSIRYSEGVATPELAHELYELLVEERDS